MNKTEAHELCKRHTHRYVRVQTVDGYEVDGFVEHVDGEYLFLAVPGCEQETMMGDRAFGYGYPLGYPGYGHMGYPGYGYGYGRRFRFGRRVFPLAGLLGLALLPYYF